MYSDLKIPTVSTYMSLKTFASSNKNPKVGDCIIKDNKLYTYNETKGWMEIGDTNTSLNNSIYYTTIGAEYQPHKLKRKTCSACGAPMHGYICEYCGSEYY